MGPQENRVHANVWSRKLFDWHYVKIDDIYADNSLKSDLLRNGLK